MPDIDRYAEGAPCWADLVTPDLNGSAAFYGDLFGWERVDAGSTYCTMTLDGHLICAMNAMPRERRRAGAPAGWLVYLSTGDLTAALAAIPGAGGAIRVPAVGVPGVGRMALIEDPSGANVALWQPGGRIGSDIRGDAGAMSWHELVTPDPSAAARFLEEVFGLTSAASQWTDESLVMNGPDGPVCGLVTMTDQWEPGTPAHWVTYFSVVDTDDAAGHVRELGGTVLAEPVDAPGGRISVVRDPQGGVFTIVAPD